MPKSKAQRYKNVGRKTVMTEETLRKLEEVFAIDGTVEEACFYADIAVSSLYEYYKINPAFSERVKALRQRPILAARQTVIKDLKTPSGAQWYLSRKRKSEFGNNEAIQGQGANVVNMYAFFNNNEVRKQVQAMEDKIKEALIQPKSNVEPI